ncbi:protein of unknown function [Chitinophaga rupis]|uniref:DUF4272 domain-containing protein n=1 Tax=Chitinophaga rupis TaxID=573321 RepID=A0A1H8A144_9BACT|nr:DUF4272 domain-containing protein [Chitinophaga rupis]SEM63634.1 protein of unknown function [Chitinophaga rupis]
MESNKLSQEAEARKARTEALLQSKGVKINPGLPLTSNEEDIQLRTKQEVIERAYALMATASKGEGVEQESVEEFVNNNAVNGFSPKERELFENLRPGEQAIISAMWRYESLNAILWSLGFVEELSFPDEVSDVFKVVEIMTSQPRAALEQQAKLRSKAEILEELDKSYRMHWACVDAGTRAEEESCGLNTNVVHERYYTLNWLTCYQNSDWDDVKTDL